MKPIVIHGAGYGRIMKRADNSILLRFDKNTDMRLTLETAEQDVWGGDGLVPFESFATEFRGSITLTNARFSLDMFKVLAGATIAETQSNNIWIFEEGYTVPAASPYTVTLAKSATAVVGSDTVRYADTLKPLTRVAGPPAAAGEYSIASGVITFYSADAGKGVLVDYQYTDAATDHVVLSVNANVVPVTIIHTGKYLRTSDGTYGGLQTEIYAAQYQGAFEINQGRATASTHAMTFKVLDPGRSDKTFMKFTRFELAA
jgi:hypothetical protein